MKQEKSIIQILIKAGVESAGQPKIYFELFGRSYISQIHSMIIAPFGLGKSSLAEDVPRSHLLYKYSLPSMVGTINKDGDIIESELFNCKKKLLIIDEGHRMDNSARDALLNLLSNGYYSRSLGFKIKGITKSIGSIKSGFMVKPSKTRSGFELWAQFSCVYLCEWLPKRLHKAFLSRFIPFIISADFEDIYGFARGRKILGEPIKNFSFTEYKEPFTVPKDLHLAFIDKHEELVSPFKAQFPPDAGGYISRNILNLLKISCHFARMENRNNLLQEDIDKVIPLILPTMKSTLQIKLSPRQFEVLSLLNAGYKQIEIAEELQVAQPVISEIMDILRQKGFIQ